MDLFERLFPDDETENLPIHYFRAALGDYAHGYTTRAEIINYWSLDAEAQTDLDVLLAVIDAETALGKVAFLVELHDVMLITEAGAKYTEKADFKTRLGL